MDFKDGSPEFLALQMAYAFAGEGERRQGLDKFLETYAQCLRVVRGEDPSPEC